MFNVGRLCMKVAGRDAGKYCVVVDVLDDHYVLVDGETRRRKVNVLHVEPLDRTVELERGASHDDVKKALEASGLKARETKPKEKKARPVKVRKAKTALKAETRPEPASEKKVKKKKSE